MLLVSQDPADICAPIDGVRMQANLLCGSCVF